MKLNKKKLRKRVIIALLCTVISGSMLLSGCASQEITNSQDNISSKTSQTSHAEANNVSISQNTESIVEFSEDDSNTSYDENNSIKISLNGSSAEISGGGAKLEGNTIKITKAGTYVLSGKLSDGQILISAGKNDTVKLVLDNADITSKTTSAIYAEKCEKTIILLADGTKNTISDTKTDTNTSESSDENENESDSDSNANAAIYIKDDLTILGNGSLTVNGNAHNGITSKDTLRITGGTIVVNAANNGITGRDNLSVTGGNITINAESDGMRSTYSDTDKEEKGHIFIENAEINITSGNDAVQAEKNLIINSGTFNIKTGDGASKTTNTQNNMDMPSFKQGDWGTSSEDTESIKGLKAGSSITINNGTFTINSEDDSVHTNGNVEITGGIFTLSTSDDGIHADNNLKIQNGTITITQSYEGLEATVIEISGGTVDLTASDDGINASNGSGSGMGGFEGFGGFNRNMDRGMMNKFGNNTTDNDNSDVSERNIPSMPDGEIPNDFNGNMPSMPDGEIPNDFEGNIPSIPESETSNNSENSNENSNSPLIKISGGTVYVTAQGDGIDSNADIEISGGTIIVNGTTNGGNGIIDHDGNCTITGGLLIGSGTYDMLEMPESSSSQNSAAIMFNETQSAGTLVYVTDSSGNVIAAMSPEKNFTCIILSTDTLKKGETYTVYTNGKADGESLHGYYSRAAVSDGKEYVSFTISDTVSYVNQNGLTTYSGGFGGGRMRGGFENTDGNTNNNNMRGRFGNGFDANTENGSDGNMTDNFKRKNFPNNNQSSNITNLPSSPSQDSTDAL